MRTEGRAARVTTTEGDSLDDLLRLNSVADKVWELLAKTKTIPDIATAVAKEFGIPRETALTRTLQIMDTFNRADLVSVSGHSWR